MSNNKTASKKQQASSQWEKLKSIDFSPRPFLITVFGIIPLCVGWEMLRIGWGILGMVLFSGGLTVVVNQIVVRSIMEFLWRRFFNLPKSTKNRKKSANDLDDSNEDWDRNEFDDVKEFTYYLAIVEGYLYVGCWILGYPQAIAGIIALKAAPQLKDWSEPLKGRAKFNIWFIGSMLSIVIAIAAAKFTLLL